MLAAGGPAAASSFSIAPIRVELGRSHPHGVFTLHNDSDAPVTVQVDTLAWSQPAGEDRYESTRDLIATPPVFVVAANSDQIVRVALRRPPDKGRELSYRLFFQEVPQATTETLNGLRVALRIGVPVFVAPAEGTVASALSWQVRSRSDGTLDVEASNQGTAHVQVTDFELQFGVPQRTVRVSGSRYVLPDCTARWRVTPPQGLDPSESLHIHAFSDQGEISADTTHPSP